MHVKALIVSYKWETVGWEKASIANTCCTNPTVISQSLFSLLRNNLNLHPLYKRSTISKVNINNSLTHYNNKRKSDENVCIHSKNSFPFIFHFIYVYLSIIYCHINSFPIACAFLAAISQTKSLYVAGV